MSSKIENNQKQNESFWKLHKKVDEISEADCIKERG